MNRSCSSMPSEQATPIIERVIRSSTDSPGSSRASASRRAAVITASALARPAALGSSSRSA